MAENGPIAVGDYVVNKGRAYLVKAVDGSMYVLEGEADENGAPLTGSVALDRRHTQITKVTQAFVNALKGTV